ncbi:MAG: hypothetical protein Q8S04_01295 [Bacteroidales bacterium]|nr:hypothetical protein [Bacteroidales bacterium]
MKKNILKWLNDWGLFIVSIIFVLLYTGLISDFRGENQFNNSVITNILFAIINLLSAFYISRKISLWGWLTDTNSNQKKIAKTAIRHNRGNLASIVKLTRITSEKVEIVTDPLTKQYLKEIQNHLEMIYSGIRNSEADFKEIVNEEMTEQNSLEIEISKIFVEIKEKNKEIEKLSHSSNTKEVEINKLKEQLRDSQTELQKKINSLPFGAQGITSGSINPTTMTTRAPLTGTIDLDEYISGIDKDK